MTKLTQQEIEKEREAFEEWVCKNHIIDDRSKIFEIVNWSDTVIYINQTTGITFSTWLARAELAKGGE